MPSARLLAVQEGVAANIRRWRAKRGLTQDAVAHAAGLGAVHYRRVEGGLENVTLATLVAVADALEAPLGQLFRPAKLKKLKLGRPPQRTEVPSSRTRK